MLCRTRTRASDCCGGCGGGEAARDVLEVVVRRSKLVTGHWLRLQVTVRGTYRRWAVAVPAAGWSPLRPASTLPFQASTSTWARRTQRDGPTTA